MRTLIIDTDTASDDAVALIMALRAPDVRVAAITVVSGNVGLDQATRNALYVTDLCGQSIPVYAGAAHPLNRVMESAQWFHGQDGLGDVGYPAPTRAPEPIHAVEALIAHIRANPGCLLVTLGPLTNVALALAQAPEIARLVDRCVVMGGAAATTGNVTPAAEYNIWVDPEAADIVLRSGLPVELVGWELCRDSANILEDEMAAIRAFDTELGHFALDCNRRAIQANFEQSGDIGLALPDPVAMAIALDPTICVQMSRHAVAVELAGTYTRGMTVVDRLGVGGDARNRATWAPHLEGRVQVCWSIDIARWKTALYTALR
ncbi:MAG: nucleoside hydrolase [Chloroflexota bacterium]|nr:nucleoside hydrolase [Chloroflexota bacterium]